MSNLLIQLLGEFRLVLGETPITGVSSPRSQSLLAFLVLHRQAPQSRQLIAYRLWPGSTEAQARTNLRNLVHTLRQALPEPDRWIDAYSSTIQWRPDSSFTLDVAEFESAVAAARSVDEWRRAVSLYSGDLLPQCYDDWIQIERDRLAQKFSSALEQLTLALEEAGDYASALESAERLMRAEPLREETYRLLMRLHARTGDRLGVARMFKRCCGVLQRELGVEPSPETCQVYERMLESSPPAHDDKRPPETAAARLTNLPTQLTNFVGREREKAMVQQLVAEHRLVTLTGTGGMGKTRLALQVAEGLVDAYPHGVWWVDLAPLTDSALVAQYIVSALGVHEVPGRPVLDALVHHVRDKSLLLLLDNCEHMVEAVGQLASVLLRAAPGLRILATSRESLRAEGEMTWRVPSMACPQRAELTGPSGDGAAASIALRYDAVRLFRDRAVAALPTFTMTDETSVTVSRICTRLDGIPLGIELAAARIRLLTLRQIAARLDDCIHLLGAGSRTDRRHETLQAAMDWSYGLLSEKEQLLLARLAVFAGGFTLEAVEGVCSLKDEGRGTKDVREDFFSLAQGVGFYPSEILDLLSSLQDKSLVEVERRAGEARSRLLEPVRQFALAKLVERGEYDLLRTRHLEFFARMAEQAELQFYGAAQLQWFKQLDRETDNIRTALECAQGCPDGGRATMGLRLAGSLMWYWYARGYWTEVRSRLTTLLAAPEAAHDDVARAKGLLAAGLISLFQDDRAAAGLTLNELRAIAARLGPEQAPLLALIQGCAAYALMTENPTAARKMADASSAMAARLPDPMGKWLRGFTCLPLGRIAQQAGDYREAREAFEAGLGLFSQVGDVLFRGVLLGYCSSLSYHEGDYAGARSFLAEAIRASRAIGHTRNTAYNLVQLGRLLMYEGEYDSACAAFEQALGLWLRLQDANLCAWTQCRLAAIATHQGALSKAARIYRENMPRVAESGSADRDLYWLTGVAGLVGAAGKPHRAVRLLSAVQALGPTPAEQEEAWRQLSGGFSRSFCFQVDPLDRAEYEGYLAAARAGLSQPEFAAAWAEGLTLPPEQAIQSAQAEIQGL